ncbi:MAG: hypothetical protein ACI8ZM_002134 [Crocinitomix sp.]
MNEIINFGTGFIAISIIIIIVGLLNFKTLMQINALRVLFCLIVASTIVDILGLVMQINGIHNIWLYNLYNLIEFSLIAYFFFLLYNIKKPYRLILGLSYFAALLFIIFVTIQQSFSEHFNSAMMGFSSIILICSSAFYFKIMLNQLEFETPWSNPFFWFSSAILIYFSGCFFIFIFSDYRDVTRIIKIWDIHNLIHIGYNLLILIGFWKARKT